MGRVAVEERRRDTGREERARSYRSAFDALELADADLLDAKATLSIAFEQRVKALGLTQTQAGERVGLTQGDVSNIIRGDLDRFSLERLIRCLNALGMDVEVVVHPPHEEPGEVRGTWTRQATPAATRDSHLPRD